MMPSLLLMEPSESLSNPRYPDERGSVIECDDVQNRVGELTQRTGLGLSWREVYPSIGKPLYGSALASVRVKPACGRRMEGAGRPARTSAYHRPKPRHAS